MSTLVIYGPPLSRASRVIWMAEELGLSYEVRTEGFAGRGRSDAAFLALNPNASVPVIDDDGFVLWESFAITLYLARKHGGPLAPASPEEEALTTRWSLWAATEVETDALDIALHRAGLPEAVRDPERARRAAHRLHHPLDALESVLGGSPFLVGDRFMVADLNVASVLGWARADPELLAARPRIAAYLKAATARPAFQALRQQQKGASLPPWVVGRVLARA